jgi:hypothetical protein
LAKCCVYFSQLHWDIEKIKIPEVLHPHLLNDHAAIRNGHNDGHKIDHNKFGTSKQNILGKSKQWNQSSAVLMRQIRARR